MSVSETERWLRTPFAGPQRLFGNVCRPIGETATAPGGDRPLLLLAGAARSGTTWLAKILDSHPLTLYRHEPDILIDDGTLPAICASEEIPFLRRAARAHLDALAGAHHLRTVGPFPLFATAYRDPIGELRRRSRVVALRGLETLGFGQRLGYAPVPDFIAPRAAAPQIVVKSVNATGRAATYLA